MIRTRRGLAGIAALGLATTGLVFAGTGASAAPGLDGEVEYVPVAEVETPADGAEESDVYNEWHFGVDRKNIGDQHPNGFIALAEAQTMLIKGNGNDAVEPGDAPLDGTPIDALAKSLSVVTSDESRVAYQVPVFYRADPAATSWSFTTLHRALTASPDRWVTSQAIPAACTTDGTAIIQNGARDIHDLAEGLANCDARPIAAGFFVDRPAGDVLVSSFTANGETTRFYEQPRTDLQSGPGEAVFVSDDDIRPDASSYQGWHEEVPPTNPDLGSFETQWDESDPEAATGLRVAGKSQLVYGFDEDRRPLNSLPEILEAGYTIDAEPVDGAAIHAQIPLFFHQEGVLGQQFTTLRTALPESGAFTDELQWTSSRDLGSIAANRPTDLDEIVAVLGDYEILGFGFTVDRPGAEALVQSVEFNGYATSFATIEDDDDDSADAGSDAGAAADPDADAAADPDADAGAGSDVNASAAAEGDASADAGGAEADASAGTDADTGADADAASQGAADGGAAAEGETGADTDAASDGGSDAGAEGGADGGAGGDPVIVIDDAEAVTSGIVQGDSLPVNGAGFLPGEQLRIELHSTPVVLAELTATESGTFDTVVTIPADTTPGLHSLVIVRADGTQLSTPLEVLAAEDAGAAENADAAGAAQGGTSADGDAADGGSSAAGSADGDRGEQELPVTGASAALPFAGAALLLAAGATLVVSRARSSRVTAANGR